MRVPRAVAAAVLAAAAAAAVLVARTRAPAPGAAAGKSPGAGGLPPAAGGAPEPYRLVHELPPAAGAAGPAPPPEVLAPFRVWVNQEQPRQRRAPGWAPFPVETATELQLEPGAAHRCLLDGAEVFAKYEDPTTLDRWRVTRTLRCSSDGFRTVVAGTVRAWYSPEGKLLDADPRAALSLVEPGLQPPRITAVVLDIQRPRRAP